MERKRLVYKKYKNCNDILVINIRNNYSIIAIKGWNREKHCYTVELRLQENTIEKWDLIEKASELEFNATKETINSAILKQISIFLQEGFFDYYIKRFEYECNCFDLGDEFMGEKDVDTVE